MRARSIIAACALALIVAALAYAAYRWRAAARSAPPPAAVIALPEGAITPVDADTARYASDEFGFSLAYPAAFAVTEYDEGQGARTIAFQGGANAQGFQIFIVPYATTTITQARLRADIPSGVVTDPQEVVLGGGLHAEHFMSVAPVIGPSSETWLIHDGYLFEFTAYAAEDAAMAGILGTLAFDR